MNDNGVTPKRNPASHLGRQMRRDRTARGWSIRELSARTKVDIATISRVETGHRMMTEKLAIKCDEQFEKNWYLPEYDASKSWIPPGLRDWSEYEDKATELAAWTPGIIDGTLQTEPYAQCVLDIEPGTTPDQVKARLANRVKRQQKILYSPDSPRAWFVVDEFALYRLVGSPEIMAAQMTRLLEVAALPKVTLTVMPPVLHLGNESPFMIAGGAAYAEHVTSGYVFTADHVVTSMAIRMDKLRSESRTAAESMTLIERMRGIWTDGVSRPTAGRRADSASR